MPKIVNHDQYRLELAEKAARLFSLYGYSGLGMRQIASELGLSKSALYHYFPSKQALFHACTDVVTQFKPVTAIDPELTQTELIHQLIEEIQVTIEPIFAAELSLMQDYMRGRRPEDIANDESMQLANDRYKAFITQYVDEAQAQPVLCMVMGTLLMRYFDGGKTDFNVIEQWLVKAIDE